MDGSTLEIALYALGGGTLGVTAAWFIQAAIAKRSRKQLRKEAGRELQQVTAQKEIFAKKLSKANATIESLQAASANHTAKYGDLKKKAKLLANNILTLRAERENTKAALSKFQAAQSALRQKTAKLKSEFEKSRDFYKRELAKSFEKRKALEAEIKEARSEQEDFAKLVESSTLEHGSTENMIVAAQLRLGQLQVLERNVNKLEAENAQLNRDLIHVRQEFDRRERDLAEMEELRLHNKQLVRCVEALESSRKEHESEAERYREQADESEKMSETLRLRLDDLAANFADIEEQQNEALNDAREADVVPILQNRS
ncbi:MAG: hypothetical protein KJO09_01310 [Gammaproteobacteria bacterium]|nr:hypothetical protein [Gammaproteobacteria bacterium]